MSNFDQLQAYLENEMSQTEKTQFEKVLETDPDLNREYTFQSEVIDGIKKERHQVLKNRLNNVEVGGLTGQYTLVKIVAAVTTVAVVGIGSYLYVNSAKISSTEATTTDKNVSLAIEDTPSIILERQDTESAVTKSLPKKNLNPKQDNNSPVTNKSNSREIERKVARDNKEGNSVPVVTSEPKKSIKPNVIEGFGEPDQQDNIDHTEVSKPFNSKDNINKSNIEIATDNSRKKYSFHYQFISDKLFLYGSFDSGLYEILEFNNADGRDLYLFYDNNFYSIDENSAEITHLNKIDDEKVIEKLRNLKNNKR